MKLSIIQALAITGILALFGCELLGQSIRPAAAGGELTVCDQTTSTWPEYTKCCLDVAKRYPLADGGKRDTSPCYAPDGGK